MKKQSGQVLVSGVIMITLLFLAVLYIFDIHNVIRAKLKVETGLQSSALTGAVWQRNSLNLIGEINLFKACSALLEGEDNWNVPLPQVPENPVTPEDNEQIEKRRQALQGRVDLLTEMQTRVAFIGPLIGFAAAQQSAKANGLPAADSKAMINYLERVSTSYRYRSELGGADDVINNYRWREPYISLLQEIGARGLAVYPNVRTARGPVVSPPELADEGFYKTIMNHVREIEAEDPPRQSSWHDSLYKFAKDYRKWSQPYLYSKWWNIDFSLNKFPNESEILTLGVRNLFSPFSGYSTFDDRNFNISNHLLRALDKASADVRDSVYKSMKELPDNVDMKWFCYDESWYPEYYRSVEEDYDQYHYNYWFNKQVLRKKVKKQYRFEGPAAYMESCDVNLDRVVRQRVNRNRRGGILTGVGVNSTLVGPKHLASTESESYATDYRPGSIAKTLGELSDNNPPIAIPLVMPVFDKVVIMPTYMPIPYGFSVLRIYESNLEKFLEWLAPQDSLRNSKNPLPPGCEHYLEALKHLIERDDFLNYGFNPDCNVRVDENMLKKWDRIREKYVYCKKNKKGMGWLQEPRVCRDPEDKYKSRREQIVEVPDLINGGIAKRIYISYDSGEYYVIDSKGRLVTNDDVDPTIRYGAGYPSDPGTEEGFGHHRDTPDLDKGPVRL